MARFRCRACNREGVFTYAGRHECPVCGSPAVQFALRVDEMPDELIDQLIQTTSQAVPLDDHPDEESC